MNNSISTYISVHDENIILSDIKYNKYSNIGSFYYVFLGYNSIEQVKHLKNLIICRDFENNIEKYNKYLCVYTGWHVLNSHNLINTDRVRFLEYDTIYKDLNNDKFDDSIDIYGYIKLGMNEWLIHPKPEIDYLIDILKNGFKYDINYSKNNFWIPTTNCVFKNNTFKEFINWTQPIIDHIKEYKKASELFERLITFYSLINNIKYGYLENNLIHYQLNSHRCQNINKNYIDYLEILSQNRF